MELTEARRKRGFKRDSSMIPSFIAIELLHEYMRYRMQLLQALSLDHSIYCNKASQHSQQY